MGKFLEGEIYKKKSITNKSCWKKVVYDPGFTYSNHEFFTNPDTGELFFIDAVVFPTTLPEEENVVINGEQNFFSLEARNYSHFLKKHGKNSQNSFDVPKKSSYILRKTPDTSADGYTFFHIKDFTVNGLLSDYENRPQGYEVFYSFGGREEIRESDEIDEESTQLLFVNTEDGEVLEFGDGEVVGGYSDTVLMFLGENYRKCYSSESKRWLWRNESNGKKLLTDEGNAISSIERKQICATVFFKAFLGDSKEPVLLDSNLSERCCDDGDPIEEIREYAFILIGSKKVLKVKTGDDRLCFIEYPGYKKLKTNRGGLIINSSPEVYDIDGRKCIEVEIREGGKVFVDAVSLNDFYYTGMRVCGIKRSNNGQIGLTLMNEDDIITYKTVG